MPKVPACTLSWSPMMEAYELYQTRDRRILSLVPDSPEWFAWLDQVSSFAFSGKSGHYTARQESKQRGDRYWYAYLARGAQLSKKYLGKSADLTLTRLEQIAEMLGAQSETQLPPPITRTSARADNEVDDARPPVFPQQRYHLPPLLATKLYVPRPRAHLVEWLQQGVERPLILVSAPAGFGKTTLLAQWLAASDMPAAWLSLEAEDNDPTRFLSYVIAALQTLDPQLGMTALALLHTPQPPSPETVLTVLVNDLVERGGDDLALVLDDYHVITAEPIHRGMAFLLEHLPPQLHLILATRADPPLPLARLRVLGQLLEVRAADSRFGSTEASTFLQEVMGLELPREAIATLESKTEGWIAGLQLAALSLQGRVDTAELLEAFSGSHRFVLDYLSDEILARQPAPVQQFLLHTSILDRLSGPLCDAVTEQEDSQAMLEALERANLFVVALDDERGWYRYHHLFADVLRRYLQLREPTLMPELHRYASLWYEQHELPIEAVQHALAIPDADLAARFIESIALSVAFQGQISTVLGWFNALPETLVRMRPFLCVYYALLLTFTNHLQAARELLQEAEQRVKKLSAEQERIIRGWVLVIQRVIAGLCGDVEYSISLARKALDLLPETEVIPRMGAMLATASAYLMNGDVTLAAEHEVVAAVTLIHTSNDPFAALSSIALLARLRVLQGKLSQAVAAYAQVVQVVPRPEVLQAMFNSLSYYFGLGDLLCERNDLEKAEQHLMQGMRQVKEALSVEPAVAIRGYTALARLRQACGNSHEALTILDALRHLAEQRHFAPP